MPEDQSPVWRRRGVVLGALAAVVVLAAGAVTAVALTGDDDPPPRPAAAKPMVPRLHLGEPVTVHVLGSQVLVREAGRPEVRDGLALMHVEDKGLALVEVATGEKRWSLTHSEELPANADRYQQGTGRLVGAGVLVAYRNWAEGEGIALLSLADGSEIWRRPLPRATGDLLWLRAADETTAVVTAHPEGAENVPPEQLKVYALDVATGAVRWESRGAWPYAIAGDTLLGEAAPFFLDFGRFYRSIHSMPGVVTALDLATGAPKWTVENQEFAQVIAGVGDTALVRWAPKADVREWTYAVLDTADGRVITEVGEQRAQPCGTDWERLIVCVSGDRLQVFDVATRSLETVPGPGSSAPVELVWRDRIFVDSRTVDLAGTVVDRELPDDVVAASDGYLVAETYSGEVSAYPLRPR